MKYNMLSSEIRVMGRTIPGETIPLFWTASGIETIFEGTDLFLEYESEYAIYEDWIRVEMNGSTVIRMPLEKGQIVWSECSRKSNLWKMIQTDT